MLRLPSHPKIAIPSKYITIPECLDCLQGCVDCQWLIQYLFIKKNFNKLLLLQGWLENISGGLLLPYDVLATLQILGGVVDILNCVFLVKRQSDSYDITAYPQ